MAITLIKSSEPTILKVMNQDKVTTDMVVEYYKITGDAGGTTTVEIPTKLTQPMFASVMGIDSAQITCKSDLLVNGTVSYNGATVASMGITLSAALDDGKFAMVKVEGYIYSTND